MHKNDEGKYLAANVGEIAEHLAVLASASRMSKAIAKLSRDQKVYAAQENAYEHAAEIVRNTLLTPPGQ